MKNIKKIPLIFSILSILTFFTPANAEIKVVASIKPIHSLASYLMDGIAKPDLIVDGYASPHGFAMKPSHAKMLQNADLIFWVGEDLENFLEKPLKSIKSWAPYYLEQEKLDDTKLLFLKELRETYHRECNVFNWASANESLNHRGMTKLVKEKILKEQKEKLMKNDRTKVAILAHVFGLNLFTKEGNNRTKNSLIQDILNHYSVNGILD